MWKKLRNSSAGLLLLAAIPMLGYAPDCLPIPSCLTEAMAGECPIGYVEDLDSECCIPGTEGPDWINSGYCCWSGDTMFTGDNNPPCCVNIARTACVNRGESTVHYPRRMQVKEK